jgi:hypothetical protein
MADQDPNKILQETAETIAALKDAFNSLGAVIKNQLNKNLIDADDYTKQYVKSLRGDAVSALNDLGKKSEKIVENQFRLQRGQITSKDISKQIDALELKRLTIHGKIVSAVRSGLISAEEGRKTYLKVAEAILEGKEALESQNNEAKEIEKRFGLIGKAASSLSSIPGLGKFINAKELEEDLLVVAAKGGGTLKQLGTVSQHLVTNLKAAIGPAFLALITQAGFKADAQTTQLAKSLTQTKGEAALTRDNLADMARESDNVFITTEKLVQSTLKLGQQLGVSKTFSADLTKEFTTLTTQIGLSEESAGGLAKLTVANGVNARKVTTEALGAAQALQSQNGIQLDNKQILEETGKVSGQLLANFKGNPTEIAKAVTQTKLLGTTLEQTKKQSSALLDFQSSIQNELSAELFTGQQLNLERARALALAGDQAGVAKELANQNMDFTKFSKLNVLAQNEFAKGLGLNADELSDQLLKQKYLNASREEVAALEGEEVAKRLEAMTAQDKFNASVEKLKDIFVSLVDGPVGQMLNLVADLFGLFGKLGKLISSVVNDKLLKILGGAAAGAGVGSMFGPVGALIGGGVGLVASGVNEAIKANDLMSGYGERTLVTPKGAFALNNNDTVIAGTNLFRGNDVYSGPKGALSMSGGSDVVDAIAKLGDRINQLAERPVVARPSEFVGPITSKQLQNSNRILV